MTWICPAIGVGLLLAVGAAVFGTAVGCPLLKRMGVSNFEGKAAYYAAFFIGVPMAVLGLILGILIIYHWRGAFHS